MINGKLLEEWIGGQTRQSQCCDVCGPNDCRTMAVDGCRLYYCEIKTSFIRY
ncbi:MAG: DUF2703 domain-containing protein [Desulfuromonadales bacterium]|nr:DUF2703 domain-containing protein [Desulfuromonadales bacterium]